MYLTYRLETYGAHTLYLNQHSRQSTSIYLYYFFCSIRLNESSREMREIARGDVKGVISAKMVKIIKFLFFAQKVSSGMGALRPKFLGG